MGLRETLQTKLDAIGEKIEDLASLDVTTLSGDVNLIIDSENGKFKLENIIKELGDTTSALNLSLIHI